MCGIIGYTGNRNTVEILLSGLSSLEYRGYDSAGIAVFGDDGITTVKTAGRISGLRANPRLGDLNSTCGIGHTRWATHGAPNDTNAHPHTEGVTTIVHNGIIENHAQLKASLEKEGYKFISETDTEVAAARIDASYKKLGEPVTALCDACSYFRGSYAFAVMFKNRPGVIYTAKKDSPLIIGLGEGDNFVASDITAILKYTKRYIGLLDGEIAEVGTDGVTVYDNNLNIVRRNCSVASWDTAAAEKGGYPHFMLKEINEEPTVLKATLAGRITDGLPDFSGDTVNIDRIVNAKRIYIVGCGTAMHAGLYGKYMTEKFARIFCDVEIASEFRYKDPILGKDDAVIIISQSGETADSLAALRLAKQHGAYTAGIVNVVASSIAREADGVIYTHAGPEIAVASTKAYVVQTAVLLLIAVKLGIASGNLPKEKAKELMAGLSERLPVALSELIDMSEYIKNVARECAASEDMFYIGRGADRYVADEGSLKLKEISYVHSEAYAAGELKHGTISLITEGVPVMAFATQEKLYEKIESNVREVRARGAKTIMVCPERLYRKGDSQLSIILPELPEEILPITAVVACQIFAYHMAILRGTDVDKPRNLAKSVTVE